MAQVWMKDVADSFEEATNEEWRGVYVDDGDYDLYEV